MIASARSDPIWTQLDSSGKQTKCSELPAPVELSLYWVGSGRNSDHSARFDPTRPIELNLVESNQIGRCDHTFRQKYMPEQDLNIVLACLCLDVNECLSNPCLNGGQCNNGYGLFTCMCSSLYSGYNCERTAGWLQYLLFDGLFYNHTNNIAYSPIFIGQWYALVWVVNAKLNRIGPKRARYDHTSIIQSWEGL